MWELELVEQKMGGKKRLSYKSLHVLILRACWTSASLNSGPPLLDRVKKGYGPCLRDQLPSSAIAPPRSAT